MAAWRARGTSGKPSDKWAAKRHHAACLFKRPRNERLLVVLIDIRKRVPKWSISPSYRETSSGDLPLVSGPGLFLCRDY